MTETISKRTGWVTFAAMVMFVVGAMNLIWAIEEFSGAAWLKNISTADFGTQFTVWAIVDLILAIVAFGAGYSIWQGGKFGFWVAMVVSILSIGRAFLYIPWIPFGALIVIVIDLLIIYALSSSAEYFGY
ncbi:MAG: hypothetical protein PVF74_07355 [Anaerolineales bacterium]